MLEPQKKTIQGYTVTVGALPAWQSLEVLQQLSKMIGPAVARLGTAAGASSLDTPEGNAQALAGLGDAITGALTALKPGELVALSKQLLSQTLVLTPDSTEGKEVPILKVFDQVFQGQILLALKIITFAIEVNFGDFFAALKPALKLLESRLKSAQGDKPKLEELPKPGASS